MRVHHQLAIGGLLAAGLLTANRAGAQDAVSLYRQTCQGCHGATGKGDGPAAAGLKPPPPDLTDAARMTRITDARLTAVIIRGSKSMPAYGTILKPSEVHELVVYIRTLSRKPRPQ